MGQQLEVGTQFPMRPSHVVIATNAALTVPNDPAPVDWTAAGTKVLLASSFISQVMDGEGNIAIDAANEEIDLRPGIYRVAVNLRLNNVDASNPAEVRVALTNGAGTTVYDETINQEVQADVHGNVHILRLLHLTVTTAIAVRVAQVVGSGTDLRTLANDIFLEITKIGNANEA